MQGTQVQSLVRELRYHMLHDQKKQNIKQKQHCNKFSKNSENVPYQKKKNLLKNHMITVNYSTDQIPLFLLAPGKWLTLSRHTFLMCWLRVSFLVSLVCT